MPCSNSAPNRTGRRATTSSRRRLSEAARCGLGLPDRDYCTKTDDASKKIREQYVAHVVKMFRLLGENAARAAADAATAMAIEPKVAEPSLTDRALRRRPRR